MKIKFSSFIILLFIMNVCMAQQTYTLKGSIYDKNNDILIGANISIEELKTGTISDIFGKYIFEKLDKAEYNIKISYIGFNTIVKRIIIDRDMNLDFHLEEGVILEAMIVTAQKREQSIKDVPTAMSSLSVDFIEKSGSTEIDQLAEYIPGLQVQIQSPNNPGFVIRGITSDDGASNIEPRVSIFQDGVSISKSRGSVVEIFDMERIEVLKGPQGTLFGRGAQIGAIHLIQNKAVGKNTGSIKLSYGDYKYKSIQGHINRILIKNKLFIRCAGIYKKRNGFINNLSSGRLNGKETKAIRAGIRYITKDKTCFNLIYNFQRDTPPGTAFKSGSYSPLNGDTKAWNFADLDYGDKLGLKRNVWGLSLLSKHYFSPSLQLSTISAYREFKSKEIFDADGTNAPALLFKENSYGKQFSQELRFNLEINNKLSGFVAVNYLHENVSQAVPFISDERSYLSLISPLLAQKMNPLLKQFANELQAVPLLNNHVPVLPNTLSELLKTPLPPFELLPSDVQKQVAGLYALSDKVLKKKHEEYYKNYAKNNIYDFIIDGTYKLSSKLKISSGLRYSIEHIESAYEAGGDEQAATLGFARSAGSNLLFMPTEKISKKKTFNSVVGRLAINYSINKEIELYTNISRGRRPKIIQFKTNIDQSNMFISYYTPEILKEEIVNSYEIGAKALLNNNKLYIDIANYYYRYSNFQSSSIDPQTSQIITKDAGDAFSYGLETSFKWQISKLLNIHGNYSFIHARFKNKNSDGEIQDLAGKTFRLTPKHTYAIGFDINKKLSDKINIFLRPNYSYKSKVFFEESNLDIESQKAYAILNMRLGVNISKPDMNISIFSRNCLDKKYLIDAGNVGRNFGIPTYISGSPRMTGIEIKWKI